MEVINRTKKTGILLVNLGTPDSPNVADVRKYLREFLMDRRVIDIPYLSRWLLVNFIIAPFRGPKSAKIYKELWQEDGSPLKTYGYKLCDLLQAALGDNYLVSLGMRYQNPSIKVALDKLKKAHVEKIIIIPLFPQYASASTGSVAEKVMDELKSWEVIPEISLKANFVNEPLYTKTFATIASKYLKLKEYDHILFSYHGLPERQITKASVGDFCKLNDNCCAEYCSQNHFCYRAQCFETSRLLAKELGLAEHDYTVCFQSRLGKSAWIKPYSDDVIKTLPARGIKSVLAFSPAFVADCLETTIEVGEEFKEMFLHAGGESWQLVESLNDHGMWVECLTQMIKNEK